MVNTKQLLKLQLEWVEIRSCMVEMDYKRHKNLLKDSYLKTTCQLALDKLNAEKQKHIEYYINANQSKMIAFAVDVQKKLLKKYQIL